MPLAGWIRGSVLFVGLVALVGCGSGSKAPPKPVHPVSGQVLVNGKAAPGAFVLFIPVKENAGTPDPRPRAIVGEDGSFKLSTYGDNDGAPEGEYVVTVTWPEGERSDEDRLGGRYANRVQSGLKATVKEGPNEIPAFKLSR